MIAMRKMDLPENLQRALEELEIVSKDPAMRVYALSLEMGIRDEIQLLSDAFEKGFEKGFKEGYHQEMYEIAKRMKSQGFPSDQIQELTGFSLEELEEY